MEPPKDANALDTCSLTIGFLSLKAVNSGHWILYRFDPRLKDEGKNPLQLDSKAPTIDIEEYIYGENRFRILQKSKPEAAAELLKLARTDASEKYALMEQLANLSCGCDKDKPEK